MLIVYALCGIYLSSVVFRTCDNLSVVEIFKESFTVEMCAYICDQGILRTLILRARPSACSTSQECRGSDLRSMNFIYI